MTFDEIADEVRLMVQCSSSISEDAYESLLDMFVNKVEWDVVNIS